METEKTFRQGNRALAYIHKTKSPLDDRTKFLIDLLPSLGKELFDYGKSSAKTLSNFGQQGFVSRLRDRLSGVATERQETLTLCVFDLALMVYFNEVNEFSHDNDLASLLTDALLFEATGTEAGAATEAQLLFEGTHNIRGLHKYFLSKQKKPHLHPVNWVFGKELSAMTTGSPLDFAVIASVGPFSLSFRTHITWIVRYRLTGKLPTEEQKKALENALAKEDARLSELTKQVGELSAEK